MFQIVTIVLCLAAAVVAFWSPVVSWCIVAVPLAWFYLTLYAVKPKSIGYVPELSMSANVMLNKFGHYYGRPFGARDISASASTITLAAILLVVIGCFKGFWWGIAVGLVVYVFASFVARQFNPANFLVDTSEQLDHQEIVAWLQSQPVQSGRAVEPTAAGRP